MTMVDTSILDDSDWHIVELLQADGRMPVAALAREVRLSATAVTQRLARLQETGVIAGYTAVVDPAVLGLTLTAYVRMRSYQGAARGFARAVVDLPEVLECHHITGEDCYLLKIVARDVVHLEEITERIAAYGQTTSSIVYSSVVAHRPLARGAVD